MTPFSDDQIRDRARALWDEAGQPEGRDMEFWLTAERQLLLEEAAREELETEPMQDDEVSPTFAAGALAAVE